MMVDDLLTHIFPDSTHPLLATFASWIETSPRFRAFAWEYRDKIRKKVRVLHDDELINDLRCELEVAFLLLQERRFTLAYEQGGVGKQRRPDFTVTFKTHTPLHVEVTRLRASVPPSSGTPAINKLINVVGDKVGQTLSGAPNVLFVMSEGALYADLDLTEVMRHFNQLIERKDERLFARRGIANAQDFFKHYAWLSAIVLRRAPTGDTNERRMWTNNQARHKLSPELYTILQRL